jgi:hypothetical protein
MSGSKLFLDKYRHLFEKANIVSLRPKDYLFVPKHEIVIGCEFDENMSGGTLIFVTKITTYNIGSERNVQPKSYVEIEYSRVFNNIISVQGQEVKKFTLIFPEKYVKIIRKESMLSFLKERSALRKIEKWLEKNKESIDVFCTRRPKD